LVRARRYFIEQYLRLHHYTDVRCHEEHDSIVFSMTAEGRSYWLWVSETWLMASTHARVEERLDRLQTCRKMREHGAAYLDMTRTGQEVVSPSYRLAPRGGRAHKDDEQKSEND
jgi:hypothetical protein